MSIKPKILIVDDRVENLVALEIILSSLEVELIRATSGNEALALTLENDFALALMDVQMPGMDGYETVTLMRQEKKTEYLPVIFISAVYSGKYYEIKGVEAGAVDFIEKPLQSQVLLGKVKNFLSLYQYRRGLEEFNARLEARVQERTRDLELSNTQLLEEMAGRKKLEEQQRHSQRLMQTRLNLLEYAADHSIAELLTRVLDQIGLLVDSPIGFYHFVNSDQKTVSLQQWSSRTLQEFCHAEVRDTHYAIEQAGVWADCARERKPLIHNDYAYLPNKKGLPAGHATVVRELVVPVLRQEKVVAILGVGNKPEDYTDRDAEIVAYLADVTWQLVEQKRAEITLRESEEQYRLLFLEMMDGFALNEIILDAAGHPVDFRFLAVNPAYERITGLKGEEILDRTVLEVLPTLEPFWIEIFGKVTLTGQPAFFDSYTGTLKKHFEVKAYRSSPGHFVCIVADITERKQAQLERERLLAAIEQAGETIVITDVKGTIQYVNPAFERITGYSKQEAIGSTPRILKSGQQDEAFYHQMWSTITSGWNWQGRLVNRRKDGSLYTEEVTISPVLDPAGAIVNYVAVKRDITEHLKLSARLQQAQKLEAIGTLAGGIAHDFNNILTAILGYGELALEKVGVESKAGADLREVLTAGKRAVNLVRQILTISRQQNSERQPVQIQFILKEALKLLRPTMSSRIELKSSIDQDCPPILADPTEIHQVIMNLCTNAYHATQERDDAGEQVIEISLAAVEMDSKALAGLGFTLSPGRFLKLTVTDNGCGMTPEIKAKIFEPYFTTKKLGKGTGLGLAMVYGIVTQCGGAIAVDSDPGWGSTFEVYFPVASGNYLVPEVLQEHHAKVTGSENIMVIDDEESIGTLLQRTFERLGYRVTVFTDSGEAMVCFRENPAAFDFVITDLNMPKMTGNDLAREFLEIRPDLPIILCTGFTEKVSLEECKAMGIRDLLTKPVDRRSLVEMVRKILDGNENG